MEFGVTRSKWEFCDLFGQEELKSFRKVLGAQLKTVVPVGKFQRVEPRLSPD